MNTKQLKILATEIKDAAYNGLSKQAIVDKLNDEVVESNKKLDIHDLRRWSAAGPSIKLEDIKNNIAKPASLRSLCKIALILIEDPNVQLDLEVDGALLTSLGPGAGNVLTSAEIQGLRDLAVTNISRAKELELGKVKVGHLMDIEAKGW